VVGAVAGVVFSGHPLREDLVALLSVALYSAFVVWRGLFYSLLKTADTRVRLKERLDEIYIRVYYAISGQEMSLKGGWIGVSVLSSYSLYIN